MKLTEITLYDPFGIDVCNMPLDFLIPPIGSTICLFDGEIWVISGVHRGIDIEAETYFIEIETKEEE